MFATATDYVHRVLGALTPDDLVRPTPCEDWDAGRVVLHIADAADGLVTLLEAGTLALPQPPRTDDADPVTLALDQLAHLTRTFAVTADASRVDQAALAGTIELTTHGWDIAVAIDPTHQIPDALARDVLTLVAPILDIDARGDNFSSPVAPPSDATATDRLVAFLGRVPRR